jgi:hypothetical protein
MFRTFGSYGTKGCGSALPSTGDTPPRRYARSPENHVALRRRPDQLRGSGAPLSTSLMPRISPLLVILTFLPLPTMAAGQDPAQRVLGAVFAHADDELDVAPMLSLYASRGHDVYLVFATRGKRAPEITRAFRPVIPWRRSGETRRGAPPRLWGQSRPYSSGWMMAAWSSGAASCTTDSIASSRPSNLTRW